MTDANWRLAVLVVLVVFAGLVGRAAWEYEREAVAQQAGCTVVDTFTGQGSLQTQPFSITADQWQFTYEVSNLDPGLEAGLIVTVYNANNDQIVTSASQDQPGSNTSAVNAGAGSYYLDIFSVAGDWTVTVEECGALGAALLPPVLAPALPPVLPLALPPVLPPPPARPLTLF